MLFCLWVLTLLLAITSYLIFRRDILAPCTLFAGGFLFSLSWALLYSPNWVFSLHDETFFVVLFALLTFIIVAGVVHLVFVKPKRRRIASNAESEVVAEGNLTHFQLPFIVIASISLLQLVVLLLTYSKICQLFPSDGLLTSISWYNNAIKFSTDTSIETYLGFPLAPLRTFMICVGYVTTFYFANSIVNKRWNLETAFLSFSFLLSVAIQMSTGGRLPVVLQLFLLLVCALYCYRRINGKDFVVPKKAKRILFVSIVLGLVLFELSAALIGRASDRDPLEYLAIYLGAQIPNLDQFIQSSGQHSHGVFGYMTFISLNNWIGAKFNIGSLVYTFDQPFLRMNLREMGNVYSILYSFYYDFGFAGVVPLTGLMAFVSQFVYEKWSVKKLSLMTPSFLTLVYGDIAYCVFMSFYCNRFYEDLFCVAFLYQLVYIFVADYLISRFAFTHPSRSKIGC